MIFFGGEGIISFEVLSARPSIVVELSDLRKLAVRCFCYALLLMRYIRDFLNV